MTRGTYRTTDADTMNAQAEIQSIRIPPTAAHVATIRVFVGAIARQVGCSEEMVEDLRLVASEAAAQAIEEGAATEGVELRIRLDGANLTLEIEPSGAFSAADADGDRPGDATERRALIQALFPQAEFEASEERSLLRLTVRHDD